ncbi:hypothetical protein BDZ97DRAFT_1927504 [Flammula alnicola]|nr:hypothetical protein BDZ97DRAFT_1927504 [Flammula alnicola]
MSTKRDLGLFDELSILQRSTDELAVWSNLALGMVIVAYPMSRGKRIQPDGLLGWMERRALIWLCICAAAAQTGEARSCRIVEARNGRVYAFCCEYPTKCNFFVDITRAHEKAEYVSEYISMPTSISSTVPDMEGLRERFLNRVAPVEVLPYFEGYFGEHESMYPGLKQLSGGFLALGAGPGRDKGKGVLRVPRSISDVAVRYSPTQKTQKQRTVSVSIEAGPSHPREDRNKEPTILSTREYNLLADLARGDGIEYSERDDLFEACDRCGLVFMRSAIRAHIRLCVAKRRF